MAVTPRDFEILRTSQMNRVFRMAQMDWGSYLETGHPGIDQQHKALVDLVNQFEAGLSGYGRGEIEVLLRRLQASTMAHFQEEEDLMERSHYPGMVRHKKLHRIFENQLAEMVEGYQQGTLDLSIKVLNLLQDWNPMHILTEDQDLVDYLDRRSPSEKPLAEPGADQA